MSWSVPDDGTGTTGRPAHCGNCRATSRAATSASVSTSSTCIRSRAIAGTLPGGAAAGQPTFSGGGGEHPRADGGVGGLVDQDEPAGDPVAGVVVDEQRLGGAQLHAADVVEPQGLGVGLPVQRVDVELVG